MTHFDLLLIGTGSGNMFLDDRFSGLDVAIAEEWHFGGTCLNVGCIPTKMFVYPATIAEQAANAQRYNVTTDFHSVDWPALQERIFGRVDAIEAGGRDYRSGDRQPNVSVVAEHVHFTAPKTVQTASGEEITAARIVIAAGASPFIPDAKGLDPQRVDTDGYPVFTSDSIMRVPQRPERLVIIGSGIIAMEFAHVFAGFGTEVTVIARGPRLLGNIDEESSDEFTKIFERTHTVHRGAEVSSYRIDDEQVSVTLKASGRLGEVDLPSQIETDAVLIATGRTPNTTGLNAAGAGFDVHDDGRLHVDSQQRVLAHGQPVPGVFALGDISSPHQLKHVANHEADVVGDNLAVDVAAGEPGAATEEHLRTVNHHAVPGAVFTSPQVAYVGITEDEARRAGHDVSVKVQKYSDVAYGWAMADDPGIVKIIADQTTRQILGAQIVGHEASMIVQPLIQAMAFGLPADEMANRQYWIHPALPEVVENALLGLDFDAEGPQNP
ncbi:MAG: mycothione reductase [Brevibacterium sp.]|uniref:mycothione reductase n=1 Tax=Brevibacterium sp. TaxID=1701 RepID=UPI0026473A82|nr:mycothione reductase [Brevibacterium sp.]MDN5807804.1 mycothione reductase [Brevibacterium sp.]MDN5834240.1 mycothione reductase [Brevibacterium sp.]MDN5877431.1 mycothione reductase [Brevibacterium sp.]MDN5910371.1 mycothione reductase [Brevibacterium sp.]MDN6134800.1 mycothione reductase [Brevibacterium sp.]